MDKLCGHYKLDHSDNFDAYMKKIGVGWTLRTIGNSTKPSVEIAKINNDEYALRTFSTFKNTEVKFKLGQEMDETTLDGRHVKTVFSMDGDKLVQTQKATKPNEKDSTITRYLDGDYMITKLVCEEVEATRTYSHQQK